MSEVLEDFMSSRLPITGLAAYSVQLPDRVLTTQALSKSLYPAATERMLTGVVQSGRALLPAGQSAASYCWVFERLRVYVAARRDGICLALLVTNEPGIQMRCIQETLQAFGELPEL